MVREVVSAVNSNGAGILKRWQVYVGLMALLVTCGTIVWKDAAASAKSDTRLSQLETEMKTVEIDYARKDLVEQKLDMLVEQQKEIKEQLQQQGEMLNKYLRRN